MLSWVGYRWLKHRHHNHFMHTRMSKLIESYNLNMCCLLNVNYTSLRLFFFLLWIICSHLCLFLLLICRTSILKRNNSSVIIVVNSVFQTIILPFVYGVFCKNRSFESEKESDNLFLYKFWAKEISEGVRVVDHYS